MFRRPWIVLAMLVVGLTANPITAQEKTKKALPSNYKHLKKLNWLIGDWQAEVKAKKAIPGVLKPGETFLFHVSAKWILNKNAIRVQGRISVKKKTLGSFESLTAWDSGKKQIVTTYADSDGMLARAAWTAKGKTWHRKIKIVTRTGDKLNGTTVFSKITPNSYKVHTANMTRNGKKVPGGPNFTLKRVKK